MAWLESEGMKKRSLSHVGPEVVMEDKKLSLVKFSILENTKIFSALKIADCKDSPSPLPI